MIYFVAEDNEHYSEENIQKLKEKYSLSEICIFPDMADVKSAISGGKKIGLIAPYTPSKLDARFDGTSFFEVIYLQNTYFPFTKDHSRFSLSFMFHPPLGTDRRCFAALSGPILLRLHRS